MEVSTQEAALADFPFKPLGEQEGFEIDVGHEVEIA